MPEALESWPVALFERLLPRHLQIIYQINARHLDSVAAQPGDDAGARRAVSLIDEQHGRRVRMGHLAFLGSHKVNGVSALHTELMRETVFADLHRALSRPHHQQDQRHHRRALAACRRTRAWPRLAHRGGRPRAGSTDAGAAGRPRAAADDAAFRDRFAAVKRAQQGARSRG